MVGRNIQTDIVASCLILVALITYIKWEKSADIKMLYLTAAAVGLGFWFKQIALFIVPIIIAYETINHKNIKWITKQHVYACCILALILLPFYTYVFILKMERFMEGTMWLIGGGRRVTGIIALKVCFFELLWGFSPLFFLITFYSIVICLQRPSKEEVLLLTYTGFFLLFFLFYNYHSYYMLPLVFPAAVFASKILSSIKRTKLSHAVIFVVLSSLALNSMLTLGAGKYNHNGLSQLPARLAKGDNSIIVLTETVEGSYGEIVKYYLPHAEFRILKRREQLNMDPKILDTKKVFILIHASEVNIKAMEKRDADEMMDNALIKYHSGLSFGPISIFIKPFNIHFFKIDGIYTAINPHYMWGLQKIFRYPEFYFIEVKKADVMPK